jgi:UDP-N-acetyl-D-glucosamine dehydrogenase
MELLERRGAVLAFHDPFLAQIPPTREHARFAGRRSLPLSAEAAAEVDAAIICTEHDAVDYELLARHCPIVIDTRNACARRGLTGPGIIKA